MNNTPLTAEEIAEIMQRCETAVSWVEHNERYNISVTALRRALTDIPRLLAHIAQQEAELAELREAVSEAEKLHPYKQSGNRESYSQYNEGWQDAVTYIDARLPQPPEAKGE